MHGLLIGRVEHGRMLFGCTQAMAGELDGGERLIIQRLERPGCGLCPVACGSHVVHAIGRGQAERDGQAHVRR